MLRALPLVVLAAGCAQLFGLDETSAPSTPADAAVIDARPIDAPVDARVCAGGDSRVTDPGTGACYVLFTTPMTRDNARAQCATLGPTARLASVQSGAENQLIANLAGAADTFLGGNDEVTETMFVWEDGSAVVLTNWNTGEPNNANGAFEEDCIVMLGSVPGKWDDRPCAPPPAGTGSYPFVCELP